MPAAISWNIALNTSAKLDRLVGENMKPVKSGEAVLQL